MNNSQQSGLWRCWSRLWDCWERARLFYSTLLLQGIWRRSSKIFNLVPQIFICFLSFSLFLLILQPGAMATWDDIAHTREVKCRWLGGHRLVSLFAPLCISGCSVWSARLAGTQGLGVFTGAKRQCKFCHLQKVTRCLHRANGKSANQQQLVMNATLTEPKRPTNNTSLTAADNSS